MRFKRADLPGFAIAVLAPVGMMILILTAYRLWQHEGSPVLGAAAANLAIGAGLLAAFSRFIRHWVLLISLVALLILDIVAVVVLQQTGNDFTSTATGLKLFGVLVFAAINVVAVLDIVNEGLNPLLVRRDQRIAARQAAGD